MRYKYIINPLHTIDRDPCNRAQPSMLSANRTSVPRAAGPTGGGTVQLAVYPHHFTFPSLITPKAGVLHALPPQPPCRSKMCLRAQAGERQSLLTNSHQGHPPSQLTLQLPKGPTLLSTARAFEKTLLSPTGLPPGMKRPGTHTVPRTPAPRMCGPGRS